MALKLIARLKELYKKHRGQLDAKRRQDGYAWAQREWDMRNTKYANPSFEQRDRDVYARAMIKGYIEIDYEHDCVSPWTRGAEQFLSEIS